MAIREQITFRPFRLRIIGNRVLETFSIQLFNNILMHRGKYIVPKQVMENSDWKVLVTAAFMCVVLQGAEGVSLPPMITAPNFVSVKEDVPPGSNIVNITAQDPGGGEVTITTGSSSVVYLRHNPPGLWLVILNTTLDVETTNRMTLSFTAEGQIRLPFNIELYVLDVNDVAPIFQNLPYNVDVEENTSPGNVVYTSINTTDPDRGLGGMVQFSMKAEMQGGEPGLGEIFTINPQNGDITLTGHLDYETNKFYHYIITAKDGGNLTSDTDLFITVSDVQDTPPYFTRLPYIATIDENTPVNAIVNTSVTALDGDRGIRNNITYNIYSATPSECSNMFTMSSSTGTISVSSLIDRDTAPLTRFNGVCRLFVKATEIRDGNNQSGNSTAEESVTITILDLNDIIPHFSNDTYSATVAEKSEIGTPLIIPTQIKVSDEDQDQNSIFYIDVVGEANTIFVAEPQFASSLALVQLKVLDGSQLDYEARPNISIQIRARENTTMGRSSLATVVVNIINLNDELPIFNQPNYSAVVPENSAAHQSVLTVQASDEDSGSFGRITYTLEGDSERFDVDATGLIRTRDAMLDRETKDKYLLTVVAIDGGGQRAVAPLTITVSDVNDNDPYFMTSYSTNIPENNRVPAFLLNLMAFDNDQENTSSSSLTYHIKSCTSVPCSNFSLDEQSGQLNVVSRLDYEQMQHEFGKIEIIVEARDKGSPPRSGNTTVVIIVEDLNDMDPSFTSTNLTGNITDNSEDNTMDSSSGSSIDLPVVNAPHSISVREDVPLGSVLRTIKATDPAGRPVPVVTESNSVIRIEESTNGNWNIILNTTLDREVTSGMSLSFTADPHGRIPLPFCIYMEVQDVNDVAPIFQNLPYNVDLREDTRSNQVVYTNISAFDPDEGAGGIVTFYMEDMTHHSAVNSNANFHIDPITGKILFTGTLDYETNRYYHYSVTAVDGGNLSSVTDLFIAVVQPSF